LVSLVLITAASLGIRTVPAPMAMRQHIPIRKKSKYVPKDKIRCQPRCQPSSSQRKWRALNPTKKFAVFASDSPLSPSFPSSAFSVTLSLSERGIVIESLLDAN
jgi:hypothetical protein